MKLFTDVSCEKLSTIAHADPVCVIGSCFADEMGARLSDAGFDVLRNPFGTLYNPASIAAAVERLDSGAPFSPDDCVEMGAGAGRVGSFSHHTSFSRPTAEEFLAHANARLTEDAARWRACTHVILTLGTARVWRALQRPGQPVVANCLKRPAQEFSHELLGAGACAALLRGIVDAHPDKHFLLTVSPIRHLGEGAHANTVSKATLHLAVQALLEEGRPRVAYFPAYEIVLDELRDYRFYAEDLVHPAPAAVRIVWERFLDACTDPADRPAILAAEKAARAARHRPLR
ncbi:MAG: GSCFA domain-containing protein [Bacteroidales bacterium]|jgi:hypothetical protein|nr:GSCFA domain-containing protein [Bacteroidales bacterium]